MARRRRTTKTVARGYNYAHKQTRKRLLADLKANPGQPCRRCGRPMYVTQRLDLGHPPGAPASVGGKGDRLEHQACNRGHRPPTPPPRPSASRRW